MAEHRPICPTCGQTRPTPRIAFEFDFGRGLALYETAAMRMEPKQLLALYGLARAFPYSASYDQLAHVMYPDDHETVDPVRLTRVHVCRLRRELERAGVPFRVVSSHNYGYLLERVK